MTWIISPLINQAQIQTKSQTNMKQAKKYVKGQAKGRQYTSTCIQNYFY